MTSLRDLHKEENIDSKSWHELKLSLNVKEVITDFSVLNSSRTTVQNTHTVHQRVESQLSKPQISWGQTWFQSKQAWWMMFRKKWRFLFWTNWEETGINKIWGPPHWVICCCVLQYFSSVNLLPDGLLLCHSWLSSCPLQSSFGQID